MPTSPSADRDLRVRRYSHLQSHDRVAALELIDEAPVAHVGWVDNGLPRSIPVAYARTGDELVFHGSRRAGVVTAAEAGAPLAVTICLVDGVVLAPSLFDSTLNYRCVIAYGNARRLHGDDFISALEAISENLAPGRWRETGPPTRRQRNATAVLSFPLDHLSFKHRAGGPDDDPVPGLWTGEIAITRTTGTPVTQLGCDETPSPSALGTADRWRNG